MKELGLNPVGLLLAIERRASQLTQIVAKLGPRGSFDNLGKGASGAAVQNLNLMLGTDMTAGLNL